MRKYLSILFLTLAAVFSVSAQNEAPKNGGKLTPLKITRKVQPTYTDEAAKAGIEGTVKLNVIFLSTGQIGKITYIEPAGQGISKDPLLKYGLVDKAIEAAKRIEFIPAMRDGVSIAVVKMVTYNFKL
jgi:TonB family protein